MIRKITILLFILTVSCHAQDKIWIRTVGEDKTLILRETTTPPVNEPPPVLFKASATTTLTPLFDFSGTLTYAINDEDAVSMTTEVESSFAVDYNDTISFTFSDYNSCTKINLNGDALTRDAATWTLPTGLLYLDISGTDVSGSVSALTLPSGLLELNISGTDVTGSVTGWSLPENLTVYNVSSTSLSGDLSGVSFPSSLTIFAINGTNITGSYTSFSLPSSLTVLKFNDTSCYGTVSGWTLPDGLTDFYISNTEMGGDVSGLNMPDELVNFSAGNSGCSYESTGGCLADINDTCELIGLDYCGLSQTEVNNVFTDCVASEVTDVLLSVRTPGVTSPATDKATLVSRSWIVLDINAAGALDIIGIPEPNFGITETYRMYDDQNNWNGDLTYYVSPSGGYYTHYVDSTDENASTNGSPSGYGSPDYPRLTVPRNLPSGSIVEIHHNINPNWSNHSRICGSATAAQPIFIRGIDTQLTNGILVGYNYDAKHFIIEDITGTYVRIVGRYSGDFNNCYISVRNCDFQSIGVINNQTSSKIQNVVLYNNEVHDGGDWTAYTSEEDEGGIGISSRAEYVWVVNNLIYHNQMCAVQVYPHDQHADPEGPVVPHHIYVGKNVAYENQQNAFWSKTARDVIFSQNIAYGHKQDTTYGVLNGGYGSQYDPNRVWFLFNTSYDNHFGIRFAASELSQRDGTYVIGNVIYDCNGIDENGVQGYGDGIYAYQINISDADHPPLFAMNTIYNCSNAFTKSYGGYVELHFYNNIFSDCNHTYASVDLAPLTIGNRWAYIYNHGGAQSDNLSRYDYNLLYNSGGFDWPSGSYYADLSAFQAGTDEGDNCVVGDPLFVDPANGDFDLNAKSPFIGMTVHPDVNTAIARFNTLYGIDIEDEVKDLIQNGVQNAP